jgi:hypothetical protein
VDEALDLVVVAVLVVDAVFSDVIPGEETVDSVSLRHPDAASRASASCSGLKTISTPSLNTIAVPGARSSLDININMIILIIEAYVCDISSRVSRTSDGAPEAKETVSLAQGARRLDHCSGSDQSPSPPSHSINDAW